LKLCRLACLLQVEIIADLMAVSDSTPDSGRSCTLIMGLASAAWVSAEVDDSLAHGPQERHS